MNSFSLWAINENGETTSEAFGHWVTVAEATKTLRETYPKAIAILDPMSNEVLWIDKDFNLEVTS